MKQPIHHNTNQNLDAAQTSNATPAGAEQFFMDDKSKMSKGERWYDWIVYRGVNYWLNLTSSLVIADYFINLGGKTHLGKAASMLGGKGTKATQNWKVALEQLALNSGGWLLCIPIKLAEDNKRPLVHWLNDWLGVDQTAPDGHKMTAEEIHIENEQPKQSWLRMLGRRTLASGSTLAFGYVLDNTAQKKLSPPYPVENGEQKTAIGGKDRFTNWIVDSANKALNSGYIPGGQKLASKGWAQRYMSLAALDWINTEITSRVMHMTNGAGKGKAPHEIEPNEPAPIPTEYEKDHTSDFAGAVVKGAARPLASKASGESFTSALKRSTETTDILQLGA